MGLGLLFFPVVCPSVVSATCEKGGSVFRWDMHRYARAAWELGVRYIGGCCGFEAYHIRAVCEELVAERGGRLGASSTEKHDMWGGGLKIHTKPWVRAR